MRRVSIRPCPASTVSARLRSGGSHGLSGIPGSAATLEGGIVAEGVGNFSFEFGLVAPRSGRGQALHEQEIVASGFPDRVNDGLIGEAGIAPRFREGRLLTTAPSSGRALRSSKTSITSPESGGTTSEPTAACSLVEKACRICTPGLFPCREPRRRFPSMAI